MLQVELSCEQHVKLFEYPKCPEEMRRNSIIRCKLGANQELFACEPAHVPQVADVPYRAASAVVCCGTMTQAAKS